MELLTYLDKVEMELSSEKPPNTTLHLKLVFWETYCDQVTGMLSKNVY